MGTTLRMPANEMDHRLGPLNAPVTLVEYGDFECPYCGVAESVVGQLVKEYRSDLCFVFRHFPLSGIHPDAEFAAIASEAAGKQDKFWEMHRILFQNQEDISRDKVLMLARRINLDMDQFNHDLQSYDIIEKVKNDSRSASESGVESTPTFFINGIKFEESTNYWPLREAIEQQLGGAGSVYI
jgi:protein-disulfide isomerase